MHVRRVALESGEIPLSGWDRLLMRSASPNVFQTRAWLEEWWRRWGAGREAYVLVAEDHAGRLLGVAPLVLSRIGALGLRELSFLASEYAAPDHLDFVVAPEQPENTKAAICQYLLNSSRDWDILRLRDIPDTSGTRTMLARYFGSQCVLVDSAGAGCPFLPLNLSWHAYQQGRSGNFRQQMRAKRRQFERQTNARFMFCETPQEVQLAMKFLFRFNPARWEARRTLRIC